jgi:3D (Asp-Asp-Asp) domain-containing protein
MKMTKEVARKICIAIGVYLLTFSVILVNNVRENNINEVKVLPIVERITTKTKAYNSDMANNTVIEKKPMIIKQKSEPKKSIIEKQKTKVKSNITPSRGKQTDYDTTFELTFYSGLVCENSKYGAVTCKGVKLFDGVVANNVLPYKTKIKLSGWGVVEVLDVGGESFDSPYRLDVYVPRIKGESDNKYYNRVQNMGRIKVKGKLIE